MRPSLPVAIVVASLLAGCRPGPGDSDDTGGDDTGDDTADSDTGADSDTSADSDTGDTDTGSGRASVRVVTWNVQGVGDDRDCVDDPPMSGDQYARAIDVLRRIDADVVCIDEVCDSTDATVLTQLADELGYPTVYSPPNSINPNSFQRNGVMSRLPVVTVAGRTSVALSGDNDADDLTRLPVVLVSDLPDVAPHLIVVCQHWKSGFEDADEFRRLIDSHRTAQAAVDGSPEENWVLAMGDVNSEASDPVEFPNPFTSTTFTDGSYLPGGFQLGDDLQADLTDGNGLTNNPFVPWAAAAFETADALQQDGVNRATRPVSGKRIDYIFLGPAVPDGWQTEVFDCADDAAGMEGLPKAGDPVAATACGQASDHLPVIIDLAP